MKNTRNQDHITLVLATPETDASGNTINTVTCTIATPTAKLARIFRKHQRDLLIKTQNYSRLIEARLAEGAEASMDDQLDKNDEETYQCLFDQCASIINIPNTKDGQTRDAKAIDWEACDLQEVRNGINFFSDRLSANTSVTTS